MSDQYNPYPYQIYCIEQVIERQNLGLFLDMGLGKTAIVLSAINNLKYFRFAVNKVLIIAPKKVAEATWTDEAKKWQHTEHLRISLVLGSAQKRIKAMCTPADIYIINRDNVTWLVDYYRNDWPFDMVVLDESSSFKSPKAKRFKKLSSVRSHITRLVELTGTPSPNGLDDLWAQIYLLDGGTRLGAHYTGFRSRYFNPKKYVNNMPCDFQPREGSNDAILEAISDICISMKSEDYLQLPDVVYDEIPVVLDADAKKAYDTLERDYVMELLEESEDVEIAVTSAIALSNKLLQLANGSVYDEDHGAHLVHDCKLDAFMELIEQLSGKSVLVFYSFKTDRERILEVLSHTKLRVRELKTPDDQHAWNNHEVDVLLAHPASAAYGLNLQHGGNHVIWFGLTWSYELYTQANKRLHRQGQTQKVIIHHLVSKGTRDEDVMIALRRKDDTQQYVMESLKARINKVKQIMTGGK